METFVLLPFFLLCRVPMDADNWRYGPEYTFVLDANQTLENNIINVTTQQIHTIIKCRPRDLETLHCQYDATNITRFGIIHNDSSLHYDIKFDRQGIRSLIMLRDIDAMTLLNMLSFADQLNIGVDLRHKPDDGGAFNATERSYMGVCNNLVNISSIAEGNKISGMEEYAIVSTENSVLKKKRGEVLVIEKTRDFENCLNQRDHIKTSEKKNSDTETFKFSSRSRIQISDMGYNSYTENIIIADISNDTIFTTSNDFSKNWIREKISMNLISVHPAEEALEPISNNTETFNFDEIYKTVD